MSDFTISSAYVLGRCRYPFRSEVVMPPQAASDPDREYGTAFHDCAAKYINTANAVEALDAKADSTWACARAWILMHWNVRWVAEPAYAWDPLMDIARRIGVDIGRNYKGNGVGGGEVAGTLDVCSIQDDTVYVYEFFTGHDASHKHEQLRLQCAVAALAHGCTRAVGQVVRFADDGAYPSQPVEFDEFELSATRGEFAELLGMVAGSEPEPGEHCSMCNLAPVCPAATSIVQGLIPVESLVKPGWGLVIKSPDHARWLNDMQRLVGTAAEAVKKAVKAYVPDTGLVLSDGSLLIEGERRMPRTDNEKMKQLAISLGATPEQIESCSYIAIESSGLKVKKASKAASKRKKAA